MDEANNGNVVGFILLWLSTIFMVTFVSVFLVGCSYSITMVHTEGTASDVVDETASNTPTTSVSVPVSAAGL